MHSVFFLIVEFHIEINNTEQYSSNNNNSKHVKGDLNNRGVRLFFYLNGNPYYFYLIHKMNKMRAIRIILDIFLFY